MNKTLLLALLAALFMAGCTGAGRQNPASRAIEEPLRTYSVAADRPSPQMAGRTAIEWSVEQTDIPEGTVFSFELRDTGGDVVSVQEGPSTIWRWQPEKSGTVRVRANAIGSSGTRTEGPWSEPYKIIPPLVVESLAADRPSPQMAGSGPVVWSVSTTGGAGALSYRFEMEKDGMRQKPIEAGPMNFLAWTPREPGLYRVRALVTDSLGNSVHSDWSAPYEIAPTLRVDSLAVDKPSPRMAESGPVVWSVSAIGGVGALRYQFELEKNSERQALEETGTTNSWAWTPREPGRYRVSALVTDTLGNSVHSDWSAPYEIAPPLRVDNLDVGRPSPQMAGSGPVVWSVSATGGVGALSYQFELEKDEVRHNPAETGTKNFWEWTPGEPGRYRVRALVTDSLGNSVHSEWSAPYEIIPALTVNDLAVDRPSPQMIGTGPVTWTADISGGVGDLSVSFELHRPEGETTTMQTGSDLKWTWNPAEEGKHRVRLLVEDSLGNRLESSWYGPYRIAPPLDVKTPAPGKPAPQAAETGPVGWMIEARGGVEPLAYVFELMQDGEITGTTSSRSIPGWAWRPEAEGEYRVRVHVTDFRGNKKTSPWSEGYYIAPPLAVETPTAGMSSPQAAGTVEIPWTTAGSGGVGELRYRFELEAEDGRLRKVETGTDPRWNWQQQDAGSYRVRATITDSLGNRRTSDWSESFRVEPPLAIARFGADTPSPQAAGTVPITWSAEATGGIEPKTFEFRLIRDDKNKGRQVQIGPESNWQWRPEEAGQYRSRVVVTDALGNSVQSDWSALFEIAPPLEISVPVPDVENDQYKIDSRIRWAVQASGGVGKKTIAFLLEDDSGPLGTAQSGSSASWTWVPRDTGNFRVRALLTDALGNQVKSPWSDWKEIRGPLHIARLVPSASSPRRALQEPVKWTATTSGGVGEITYEFLSVVEGIESLKQRGSSPHWDWMPRKAGTYRVKVRAWDEEDQKVESEWSEEFRILPTLDRNSLVAVLPIENLSDRKAPLEDIRSLFKKKLGEDVVLLPEEELQKFMRSYRMRYTGGMNSNIARALNEELGVEAVFFTSLESWEEGRKPQMSMISRLVTTGQNPEIVWIDGVGLTGEDEKSLLGIGRITEAGVLLEKGLTELTGSFNRYLDGRDPVLRHSTGRGGKHILRQSTPSGASSPEKIKKRYKPRAFYRATHFEPEKTYRIAVVPFLNINARKHAGKVIALHLLKELHPYANIQIYEPGVVRQKLLRYRMIMQSGPSLASSDVLADRTILGAHLILSGAVFDYQDRIGSCRVDFSLQAFHGARREIIWNSRSQSDSGDGNYFFDWGLDLSAHNLASRMARGAVRLLEE